MRGSKEGKRKEVLGVTPRPRDLPDPGIKAPPSNHLHSPQSSCSPISPWGKRTPPEAKPKVYGTAHTSILILALWRGVPLGAAEGGAGGRRGFRGSAEPRWGRPVDAPPRPGGGTVREGSGDFT